MKMLTGRYMLALGLLLCLGACSSMYYKTMESFGVHKRDLLVSSIEDARDSQQETKEQFQSALEQFKSVVDFDGGNLEDKYDSLNDVYEKSESKAQQVKEHIEDVEDVATALFDEWKSELEQYNNDRLKKSSETTLNNTKKRYDEFIQAMKKAEEKITPVLAAFHDQVLFLKHNLNAQAIASIQQELKAVETDIATLISELEQAISEADSFIKDFEGGE